jgi:choline dehydrogenase-like flavoprotein
MEVDAAVVGGGPAGCSAAITLLSKGYSVAVINRSRRTPRPTETAPPRLKQLLLSLHAEEALSVCEPCYGICSNWGRDFHAIQSSLIAQPLNFYTVCRKGRQREKGASSKTRGANGQSAIGATDAAEAAQRGLGRRKFLPCRWKLCGVAIKASGRRTISESAVEAVVLCSSVR